MSLIICKECTSKVSDTAVRCPNCGARLKMSIIKKLFIFIAVVLLIFLIIGIIYSATTPKYKQDAERMRSTCEEYIANNNRASIAWRACQDAYHDAIRKGENLGKPVEPTPEFKEEKLKMQESLKLAENEYMDNCVKNKESIKKEYNSLAAKNQWYLAGLKVWRCADLTNDTEYKILGEKAKKNSKQINR